MTDIGIQAIERIYKRMVINDDWSVPAEPGFEWWGCELRRRIWA